MGVTDTSELVSRQTSFVFTLRPTRAQAEVYARHEGAGRFAYNMAIELHKKAKREAAAGATEVWVPVTPLQCLDAFNKWKVTLAAGGTSDAPGLPWRDEVLQLVFEEACKDAGSALMARRAWFRGERKGRCPGFARFKKRGRCRPSFRIRNKGQSTVRFRALGASDAEGIPHRAVRLPPKVGGVVRVRECTRRLRRLLAKPGTRIHHVTVSQVDGRWRLSVNVETGPLHPAEQVDADNAVPVGIDRGLTTFAVLARATGEEVVRIAHPRPLRGALAELRRRSAAVSKKKKGSANRRKAKLHLRKLHTRIRNVRHDFVRRLVSELAKTHGQLVLETLNTQGLMRTSRGMARSLADSAWALFATKLRPKVHWHGGELIEAPRNYPSTRRCSRCGEVGPAVPLSQRQFRCGSCGFEADRDTNAAVNLGQYPSLPLPTSEKPSGS